MRIAHHVGIMWWAREVKLVLGIDFDGACVQHSVNKLVKKIKMQIYVVHKIIKKLLFFKLKKHVFVFLYKKKIHLFVQ